MYEKTTKPCVRKSFETLQRGASRQTKGLQNIYKKGFLKPVMIYKLSFLSLTHIRKKKTRRASYWKEFRHARMQHDLFTISKNVCMNSASLKKRDPTILSLRWRGFYLSWLEMQTLRVGFFMRLQLQQEYAKKVSFLCISLVFCIALYYGIGSLSSFYW